MSTFSDEETVRRRKYFFNNYKSRTFIRKGDERVKGNRLCSICTEPLSLVQRNGKGICTRDHYHFKVSSLFTVNMCKDYRVCKRNNGIREEKGDLPWEQEKDSLTE